MGARFLYRAVVATSGAKLTLQLDDAFRSTGKTFSRTAPDADYQSKHPKMMIHWVSVALVSVGIFCGLAAANAAECPGNPNAIGTSRVIVVDPTQHARLGTMQYTETLPLADKEVVL